MDAETFARLKQFMRDDIERELELAKAEPALLEAAGVRSGGGNFLAALGLLCYTEFAGRVRYGRSTSTDNFNLLFDDLGPAYKAFRQSCPNVYDMFRCGMAHEYVIKQPSGIAMQAPRLSTGIGSLPDGTYYFVVEHYWRDLWVQLQAIEEDLAGASAGAAT